MSSTTIFLSRLIGLFAIVFVACLFVNRDAVSAMTGNPGVMIAFGMIAVAAGLAIVLCHNIWSGGTATVLVTLVGWLGLLKGIFLMALPAVAMTGLFTALGVDEHFDLFLIVPLVLGLYLTYSGFKPRRL